VIVVGPAPDWKQALPRTLVALHEVTGQPSPRRTRYGLAPGAPALDAAMRATVEAAHAGTYFSAWAALCDASGCLTRIGNDPDALTTWDYGHLTTPGARYLARKLAHASGDFGLAN
jgi:hypothetical protein